MRPIASENKKFQFSKSDGPLSVFLFLAIALILGWLLMALKFIFLPMILALFCTFLLNPPVVWLKSKGVPRPIGIALSLGGSMVLIWLGGRYIAASFVAFRDGFPKYEERIQGLVGHAKEITEHFSFITIERVQDALNSVSLSGLVGDTLNSFISVTTYIVVTILFLIYFLPGLPSFPEKISQAFPGSRGPILRRAFEDIGRQVQKYVWAKTLTSIITGLGVAIPCLLFGVDFAITWGVFAVLLNFIPTVGTFLSIIPPAIVCALQPELGGITTTLWLTSILIVISTVAGNVMEPLMLGKSVDLSPTASLIALFLWGWIWGAIGMLIAVPAMAIVKLTCDNIKSLKPVGVMLGN